MAYVTFYMESRNGEGNKYSEEEVHKILEQNADSVSTSSTRAGIRLMFDGNGNHTEQLPVEFRQYVEETEGATFSRGSR